MELTDIKSLSRENVALLFLSAVPAGFFGSVQLQKGIFLIARNLPDLFETPYDFIPYDYGPYCKELYSDLDQLAEKSLIKIIERSRSQIKEWIASPAGLERAQELDKDLTDQQRRYIKDVAKWCLKLSFTQIVGSICQAYPDMATKMIFRS